MLEISKYEMAKFALDFGHILDDQRVVKGIAEKMARYVIETNLNPHSVLQHSLTVMDPDVHTAVNTNGLGRWISWFLDKPFGTIYENEDTPPVLHEDTRAVGDKLIGNVLLVDGAALTGESILRSADYIGKLGRGLDVRDALVFTVRPDGEKLLKLENKLRANGIRLHYIFTANELINDVYELAHMQKNVQDSDFQ